MSKLFYDHLVIIDEIFEEIEILEISSEEKVEMKKMADEMMTHAVLTHVLDLLPQIHHEEFLTKFYEAPYDVYLLTFLKEKTDKDVHKEIAHVGEKFKKEIRREIHKHSKIKKKKS